VPLSLGLLNNKLPVAGLIVLFHPRRNYAITTEWGDAGASNGRAARWGHQELSCFSMDIWGSVLMCFYRKENHKKTSKYPTNYVLLTRIIASNSSDQRTPNNKCMWKNRTNPRII